MRPGFKPGRRAFKTFTQWCGVFVRAAVGLEARLHRPDAYSTQKSNASFRLRQFPNSLTEDQFNFARKYWFDLNTPGFVNQIVP